MKKEINSNNKIREYIKEDKKLRISLKAIQLKKNS